MPCHIFNNITSFENLLGAWREFLCGKRKRKDVAVFSVYLLDNILVLHYDLISKTYRHGPYCAFKINDPKPRDIHKATVRDRLLHRAIYRILYPYFDKKFVFDSFSCRRDKGVHRAINRFRKYGRIVSKNNTKSVYVLKCDIRKFFASIDHEILLKIIQKQIWEEDVVWLLGEIIRSFNTKDKLGKGLPLGNLTSQLFVNIYMNKFDNFIKRELKVKYYIRYADDFVILSDDKNYLINILPKISVFLNERLKLCLHSGKTLIKTFASGVDFLGWVAFTRHRTLRTSTKKRIFHRIKNNSSPEMLNSYLGLLKHGNSYKIRSKIYKII